MTWRKQTIMELAREAGIRDCTCSGAFGCLEAFAKLVREDERAECADHYLGIMRNAIKEAVKAERESCAKVCEELEHKLRNTSYTPNGFSCANAIRARKQA